MVDIIKQSRQQGLKPGKDFGLIAYNDTPAYQVIDEGITALSIDWEQMGSLAARFITEGSPYRFPPHRGSSAEISLIFFAVKSAQSSTVEE